MGAAEALSHDGRVEVLEAFERDWAEGGDVVYGAYGSAVIGGCGLHRRRGPNVLEIGYWVHGDHLGRGYATEMAASLTQTAFEVDGIDRVEIHHDRANLARGRVPEKLGFRHVGVSPDGARAPAEDGIDWTWAEDHKQVAQPGMVAVPNTRESPSVAGER